MNKKPEITVIIPTYNRENTLKYAINSALKQTYPVHTVIVLDDGSTDDTENMIRKMNSPKIKYFKNPENLGVSATRNKGIENSLTEWVAFLDSDDVWHQEKVETQVDVIVKHPDTNFVYCGFERVDISTGQQLKRIVPEHQGNIFHHLLLYNFITPSTVIMKKELAVSSGGYKTTLNNFEDWDFFLRVSHIAESHYTQRILVTQYEYSSGLSRNLKTAIDGRTSIYETFKNSIAGNKHVHANHLREIGLLYLLSGDFSVGQNYMKKAASIKPLSVLSLIHLLMAFSGRKIFPYIYKTIKKLKTMIF